MNRTILFEYDQILLGNKTDFSKHFFAKGTEYNEKTALDIIRYACEYYLRWSP